MKISDEYWERGFQIWYASNQPSSIDKIKDLLPEMEGGGKPGIETIRQAMETYGWQTRADALDAAAIQRVENNLIEARAEMFKRQAQEAFEISQKAKNYILTEDFDSSASAVNAYFKSAELERTSKGAEELIRRIGSMSQEELINRATKLLRRKNESIDGVVVDSESNGGSEDASSRSQGPE